MAIPAIGPSSALSETSLGGPSTTARARFVRTLFGNRKATAGLAILILISFVAAFPGLVTHDDPNAAIYGIELGPSAQHLLGTTLVGQDVFSQLVWSTRLTLIIVVVVSVIATFLSMIIGVTAAYLGGVARPQPLAAHGRLPDHPDAAAPDRPRLLPPVGGEHHDPRALPDQLGVPGQAAALSGAVPAQPRLPGLGQGARRATASTSSWSRSSPP